MFGRKKKSNRRMDLIGSVLGNSILRDQEPQRVLTNSNPDNLPLLSNGRKNASITHDMLSLLPVYYRMFGRWQKLDLKKCFEEEPEEPTTDNAFVQIGIDANKPLDVVERARELNDESKTRIKAFVLGEINDEDKEL